MGYGPRNPRVAEVGLTNDTLTGAAEILMQGGARDSVPDFGPMQPLELEILLAAQAMR